MSSVDDLGDIQFPPTQSANWMLTLADLISLVLTFFVLLFSMSTLETPQWEGITNSLSDRLNPINEAPVKTVVSTLDVPTFDLAKAMDLDYLQNILVEKFQREGLLQNLSIERMDDKLVISLASDVAFDPGQATLKKEFMPTLFVLGDILGRLKNQIDVIGYTDPNPISTREFPSNWELSLSRSASIAGYLKSSGYLYKLSAYGVADTRFNDIDTAFSQEERYRIARRVDVEVREGIAQR